MYRAIAGLCLIVAFSGPFLRQVEAADDLARSLVALLEPSGIASSDLGVGDEPDLIPCKTTELPPASQVTSCPEPTGSDLALSFLSLPPSSPRLAPLDRPLDAAARPARSARERQAWLKKLLF
ncbi:MAG TPA: hypothetical protein VGZ22_18755 [Isosphaeraceae bacterium]|jgi:hypothetical protein|nr:hypothetical protein [Isosphaeraceae bacterium]